MKLKFNFLLIIIQILFFCSASLAKTGEGQVGVSSQGFINQENQQSANSKNFSAIQAWFHLGDESLEGEGLKGEVMGQFSPNRPLFNYFTVSEFYWDSTWSNDFVTTSYGRKRWLWSELDHEYRLGLIEPLFNWQPSRPIEQGLTGFFASFKGALFRLNLMASPIFIPDQGASYSQESGEFVETSPWFQPPPRSVIFADTKDPIRYEINKPSALDVIFHTSYVGQLELGGVEGLYSRFTYAYKPMNQLGLAYNWQYDLSQNEVDVQVEPGVVNHTIRAMDLGYKNSDWSTGLSFLQETPENKKWRSLYTYPEYSETNLWSPYIEWAPKLWKFRVSYLNVQGGEIKYVDPNTGEDQEVLPLRLSFKKALRTSVKYQTSKVRSFFQSGEIVFLNETQTQAKVLNLSLNFLPQDKWLVSTGFDLTAEPENLESARYFTQTYAKNDRIYFGASYVF